MNVTNTISGSDVTWLAAETNLAQSNEGCCHVETTPFSVFFLLGFISALDGWLCTFLSRLKAERGADDKVYLSPLTLEFDNFGYFGNFWTVCSFMNIFLAISRHLLFFGLNRLDKLSPIDQNNIMKHKKTFQIGTFLVS